MRVVGPAARGGMDRGGELGCACVCVEWREPGGCVLSVNPGPAGSGSHGALPTPSAPEPVNVATWKKSADEIK